MGIPLCTRNIPNFWTWHYEKHGSFSVKSAYKMLVAIKQRSEALLDGSVGTSSSNAEERAWKLLWKIEAPGKIRMFLWRLSKHSLPTNDVRTHRHMVDSDHCGLCGVQDSWRHSLLECTSSRSVWALANGEITHKIIENTKPNAKQWQFNWCKFYHTSSSSWWQQHCGPYDMEDARPFTSQSSRALKQLTVSLAGSWRTLASSEIGREAQP